MKILSIYNNKGGVGKTTVTKRLALYLANKDKKVLIIDLDSQTNISHQFLKQYDNDITKVLLNNLNINEAVYNSKISNIDVVPAKMSLQKVNNMLIYNCLEELEANNLKVENKLQFIEKTASLKLKDSLVKLNGEYDYILLDCPATMDLLVANALAITGEIIIPLGTDIYSLEGMQGLIGKINEVKNNYNNTLKIKSIFLNKYKNSNIHKEMHFTLKRLFKEKVAEQKIGDYSIMNENTFLDNENKMIKHKVNKQFNELFKEIGI